MLPFKANSLEQIGYTPLDIEAGTVISGADNVVYYTNNKGEILTVNLGTLYDDTEISDAFVIDILADVGNTKTSNLRVYGDIALDSSIKEVKKVYGNPIIEQGNTALYGMRSDDSTKSVYVAVIDDKVVRIEAMNTLNFIEEEE